MRKKIVFLPYDFDTANGTNNEGALQFSYNLEDIDKVGNNTDVYNGQDSVLWKNVRSAFFDELKSMYQQLRSQGKLSYAKIEAMFEEHQAKWPEAVFNEDAWFTYLQPLVDDGDASYLSMLQGSKAEQRKWWLYNRFRYIDSKYNAGDALTDVITLRGYAKSNVSLTPYADIYATVKFGSYLVQQRATRNQTYELVCPLDNVNDTEIYIYSASQLASVGDLSGLMVGYANFSYATRLQSLKLGDSGNYENDNLLDLYLGNNVLLETIDVRNCVNLGGSRNVGGNTVVSQTPTVDLSGCVGLKNVYFDGTSVKGVTLPNGAPVTVLHLPNTITNLDLRNLSDLTDFTCPSYANITTLRIENTPTVDPLAILDEISANSRVRIIGFEKTVSAVSEIEDFYDQLDTMRGLDESGNTVSTAQVSGIIHINSMTGAEKSALEARYPYITIDAAHTTSYRYFKTWDGSSLVGTVTCIDGVAQSAAPSVPGRDSTAQYSYTAAGWATTTDSTTANYNHSAVTTSDVTYYAAYSRTVRTYTITFVRASDDGGGTLQTRTLSYGTMASYTGSTPTTTKGSATDYPFEGWSPALTTVTGAKTYTAKFGSPIEVAEISDDWDTIIQKINNGTADYKVGNYKPLSFGTEGTVNMQIVGKNQSELADGTGTATYDFLAIELLKTTHRMNPSRTEGQEGTGTLGGWDKCEMKTYLNGTILPKMPSNVRNAIKSVKKYTRIFDVSGTVVNNSVSTDTLWIPSMYEMGWTGYETSGGRYNSIFTNDSSRIKKVVEASSASGWWLRSAISASDFCCVYSSGDWNPAGAGNARGVAVGFSA